MSPDARGRRGRKVIVVSGPSGAGKGTLIRGVLPYFPGLEVAISATTREARQGEAHSREYYFISMAEFNAHVDADEFLEHVEFAGNRYGTLVSEIDRLHGQGKHVVLELELQGALKVHDSDMDSVLVWIETPDFEELQRRLQSRASDTSEEIEQRMAIARSQAHAREQFDHVVVNDDQSRAVAELQGIIERELAPPPAH